MRNTDMPVQAASRLRKNAAYFRINYLIVTSLTVAAAFVLNPQSLFVLGFLMAGWVYMFAVRQGPLVISGREIRWEKKRPFHCHVWFMSPSSPI